MSEENNHRSSDPPSSLSSSLSSLLPPPKSTSRIGSLSSLPPATQSSSPAPKKKREGTVKILVDLPTQNAESDEDDDHRQKRPRLGNGGGGGGGGLADLLPAPKHVAPQRAEEKSSVSTKSFVPTSLAKKKKVQPSESDSKKTEKSKNTKSGTDSSLRMEKVKEGEGILKKGPSEETEQTSNSGSVEGVQYDTDASSALHKNSSQSSHPSSEQSQSYEGAGYTAADMYRYPGDDTQAAYAGYYGQNWAGYWQEGYDYSQYYGQYGQEYYGTEDSAQQESSTGAELSDEILAKLGGRRGKNSQIKIHDVNMAEQVQGWKPPVQSLTAPKQEAMPEHLIPTMTQKRKHNLKYLAFQAKAMEHEYKEAFAANRKSKRETQSKYGF
ncbi:uncharacterized protein VTP21DRAFT_9828 [Calcarisporiella thermophila]|uniref:uncharacterized protein n=1 Tax=Calcarisporiella thermophila TaxID=911321 RepID=UPI0037440E86